MMLRYYVIFHYTLKNHYISCIPRYAEHGEPLHVIRYAVGQYYEPHVDYFEEEFSLVNGGQRIATMLMYL